MILQRQSGLGRGLGALIPQRSSPTPSHTPPPPPSSAFAPEESEAPSVVGVDEQTGARILEIAVEEIERNPHQPRHHFDHAELENLISSIKEHGIIQPLVVTKKADGSYQLIAGERRLRAATIAGLKTVPVVLRDATEQQKLELAIIENVQRQDLNPMDEAKGYAQLMDEFHLTQEEVAKKVGKSRPQIANTVRLLQLPEEVQAALIEGKISASNGRTLLSLPTDSERLELFRAMLAGHFTVRQTEERVGHPRSRRQTDPNVGAAENKLRELYHCRTQIKRDARGVGEIRLRFQSDEEFIAMMEKLTR